MFRFSSQSDRPLDGGNYLHRFQRELKNKVKGLERTNKGDGKSWKALERALRVLHDGARSIPPLASAVEGLISILYIYEEASQTDKNHENLASSLVATIDMLEQQLKISKSTRVNEKILEITGLIEQEVLSIRGRRTRNVYARIIATSETQEAIQSYQRVEQLFYRIQLEIGMSSWRTAHEHLENEYLENIHPVKLAAYNSRLSTEINRRACTENTRTAILARLCEWANDPSSKTVNWVSGMAGTGKTTIAYTFSKILDPHGQLAASFLCTQASPECRDAGRIIPTIAYQLARKSAAFQAALCKVIEQDSDIGSRDISTQFQLLLQQPLQEIQEKLPNNLVVVIDAPDECEDAQAVGLLISTLLKNSSTIPVKFLLTTRPELELATQMQRWLQARDICTTSHLHEVDQSTVQSDIELFLKEELAFMDPSLQDIKRLAESSGQLFIYAVTAVRYIRPGTMGIDPYERLETMLTVNSRSQKRFAHIDALYSTVLSTALNNVELEPEERDRILQVLWTVICLRAPISLEALKALTGFRNVKQTLTALNPLRSVLHVSEASSYVSVLHQSFPDYMHNPKRSLEFSCDSKKQNRLLALQCFSLMKLSLKFNICDLESSFILDKDVPDIKQRIDNNIPDSLVYVCRYWVDHLGLAEPDQKILADVEDFLSKRLLFWMEVLNLNECIGVGVGALLKLQSWLATSRSSAYLLEMASDASKFVAGFAGCPASFSTPHIYISALALVSSSSHIFTLYRKNMRGLLDKTSAQLVRNVNQNHTLPFPQHIESAGRPSAHISVYPPNVSQTLVHGLLPVISPSGIPTNEPGAYTFVAPIGNQVPGMNTGAPMAFSLANRHPMATAPHSAPVPPLRFITSMPVVPNGNASTGPLLGARVLYATPQAGSHTRVTLTPPHQFVRTDNLSDPKGRSPGTYNGGYGYRYRRDSTKSAAEPKLNTPERNQMSGKEIASTHTSIKLSGSMPGSQAHPNQAYPLHLRSANDTLLNSRIEEEDSDIEFAVGSFPPREREQMSLVRAQQRDVVERTEPKAVLLFPQESGVSSLNYPWQIRSDGWILNRNEGLLLYIPNERIGLYSNLKLLNVTRQDILPGVDWGKLYMGNQWKRCYIGGD
ncbi:Vegetative incompatibility protein HET-E-1 [Rhizoctonia solani]|uniref:Vegetative incompatibility protein HET-E-1 n=1 Tax=Rhizoctonia solani TaxID=456999 RepID=A0A8H8SUG4_9AGAM|nr:Vegetative incompatibility protein HET-E-1 [Rhizoctonia solani]QRW17367.1 Vegetative incompatibility protein HET-E-1 [Rhizoctonia solani]